VTDRRIKFLRNATLTLLVVISGGTLGYMLVEGWNFSDSLYMTIITVTTAGYEEVHPLTPQGQIFTLVLVVLSFATVIYIGSTGIQILIESKIFRCLRMQKKIEELSNHYIVCGFRRMGSHICKELKQANVPFVVIDSIPIHLINWKSLDIYSMVQMLPETVLCGVLVLIKQKD
jgi:voltage-gated potassium channel